MGRFRKIPFIFLFSVLIFSLGVSSLVTAQTPHSDGQSILKTETLGIILPEGGPLAASMQELVEKTDRALPFPKAYRFLIKKTDRNPLKVFATARDLSEKDGTRFVFSTLGSFDSEGLLKPGSSDFDTVLLPFLARKDLAPKKSLVVTANLPAFAQGGAAGKWAAGKFKRVLLLHSEESSLDVDFALGFENAYRSLGNQSSLKFRRESFAEKDVNFESYKDLLKNEFPELIVFPSTNPEILQKFSEFVVGQNYSGAVLGSEGWLTKVMIDPAAKEWIGRYVVSVYPGPFTGASLEHPEFSLVQNTFEWMTRCMEKKVFKAISTCLREPQPGWVLRQLPSGGSLLQQKTRPILWQLNRGGPRKIQDLELLKSY